MCDPVIMASVMIAAKGAEIYATNKSAKEQFKALEAQAGREREEVKDAAEEQIGSRLREARERRARARVVAGESGAMGASYAAMVNQSISDQLMTSAVVQKDARNAQTAVNDRMNTAASQVRTVSSLEAGLQLGMAGIQGYMAGVEFKNAADAKKAAAAVGG